MEWETETKDSEPENQKSLDYGDKVLKKGEWGVFFCNLSATWQMH